ncbi:hypothetical protein HQQ81_10795 [Microbacteriaceae bacterium VKM Ac-2854]|nr:hypothetical protein [Microbacteriaceae bacterium VKM Ac-2854]
MTVVLPPMLGPQAEAWGAALDVFEKLPRDWCLVGGQMVQLHCAERGVAPIRPTDDLDAVLDVRARPQVLLQFTSALVDLGFASDGESWEGYQQRWVRGDAVIDLLIPRFLGERATKRKGVFGGTTLSTPGAQSALDASEVVSVDIAGRIGSILRPRLSGAIVAKATAFGVSQDRDPRRHLLDVLVLATLLRREDAFDLDLKGYRRLLFLLRRAASDESAVRSVPGSARGLRRIAAAMAGSSLCALRGGSEPLPPFYD